MGWLLKTDGSFSWKWEGGDRAKCDLAPGMAGCPIRAGETYVVVYAQPWFGYGKDMLKFEHAPDTQWLAHRFKPVVRVKALSRPSYEPPAPSVLFDCLDAMGGRVTR